MFSEIHARDVPAMNMKKIGSIVRKGFRRLGYDLQLRDINNSDRVRFAAQIRHHQIDLVLDVGANVGQFGTELRQLCGYRGRIVSFEPLRAAHEALCRRAQGDRLWQVAPRMAIGADDGEVEINVAGNSMSSSVLPMLDSHATTAPESRYIGVEEAPLHKLDSVAFDYATPESRTFIKIDTQGFERQVLNGAERILSSAAGIQLELSLIPLYNGQELAIDLIRWMYDAGFALWGATPAFIEPETGRVLQLDGVFFRR